MKCFLFMLTGIFTCLFVYWVNIPKFKVGDCIELNSQTESLETFGPLIAKKIILEVAHRKYLIVYISPRIIFGAHYTDSINKVDRIYHKVDCK